MEKKKSKISAALFCVLVMMITAASDSLRGVFLPQFKNAFSLSEPQAGRIIMISYVGNLLFLSLGGYISDRVNRKRFLAGVMLLFSAALLSYVLTENYYLLLAAMMFSMGGSTMISTSVNIITPLVFASPAMFVSIFNFVQGVGITLSQNVIGRFADGLKAWHTANLVLLLAAGVCFVLLFTLDLPETSADVSARPTPVQILKNPASILLVFICGFYFVAEHGLMNWLTSYGSEHLGLSVPRSAFYLSMFFGGITVGRLVFAPLIDRLGVFRCLLVWSFAGVVLYVTGIALGKNGMWLLAASGLGLSIVYPMLVMLIGRYFDTSSSGSATGLILSIATFFDIGFNAFFGSLVEYAGYAKAILILPVSAVLLCTGLVILKITVKASKDIR